MTRMETAKAYLETVKQVVNEAIESGKYTTMAPDAEGITPKTRLEWVTPSIDYINGVAENFSAESINDELRTQSFDDRKTLAFYYIGVVEKFSNDQYVSEGYRNITNALDLMANTALIEPKEEADSLIAENESVLGKLRCFFKAKKDKIQPVETAKSYKEEIKKLRKQNASLEISANMARQRAEEAEAKVEELRAILRRFDVFT